MTQFNEKLLKNSDYLDRSFIRVAQQIKDINIDGLTLSKQRAGNSHAVNNFGLWHIVVSSKLTMSFF